MRSLNWTKQEFLAYILLYAAHCNQFEDSKEKEYIISKVGQVTFRKIHTEVVVDSDEENLNKIQDYIQENISSQEEKDNLLRDIKNVLFADGSVDNSEKKLFSQLKRMIG
jgi:hypothetical protein